MSPPAIGLSLPPLRWDYKQMPPHPIFSMWDLGAKSGPLSSKASKHFTYEAIPPGWFLLFYGQHSWSNTVFGVATLCC